MKHSKNTKPFVWGTVSGAALCLVLGFTWGGWVTGAGSRKDAQLAAHNATVVALAPYCAERFLAQSDATAKVADLAKASTWERGSVLEKAGFAMLPGTQTSDSDVARACAEILLKPVTPKT